MNTPRHRSPTPNLSSCSRPTGPGDGCGLQPPSLSGAWVWSNVLCLKSDQWTASQGLIVRDEANGAVMRLGRFQSQTEMKAAQETILEMARNTQVLREALLEVGPEKKWWPGSATMTESWPSQSDVSDLADEAIGVRAPKGAEFGTTEVIYLDIKQSSRERALALKPRGL